MGSNEAGFDHEQALERINQLMLGGAVPHNTALGMTALEVAPGMIVVKLPYAPHLVGNPETGVLHGGVISTLLDATAGMAVFLKMDEPCRIATVDLRIDYLRPATPGRDVVARAECYKEAHHIAFVRAVAYHREEPDDPIASAAATFMLFRDQASRLARGVKP